MSPRWATVAGYGLYFYAAERHRRPHVDVRRGGAHATLDVLTGEPLAGELPPAVLRAVQELLARYREEAVRAFNETLEHRFPGPLDQQEEGDR
jgi:hypothetical protein